MYLRIRQPDAVAAALLLHPPGCALQKAADAGVVQNRLSPLGKCDRTKCDITHDFINLPGTIYDRKVEKVRTGAQPS